MLMKIRRTGSHIKTCASCLVSLVLVSAIIYCGYKIVLYIIDSHRTKEAASAVEDIAQVSEVEDDENTEIIDNDEPPESIYWTYMKMNLIDVKFDELKKTNSDTKGWIQVKGTNINYPFVQASDNDYYLKHSFEKWYSDSGWVFADYRNRLDGSDKNMILYAHGRYDGTMFGTLRNALGNGWTNNPNNYVFLTSTESENALWQVFSAYRIPTTSDYLRTEFASDESFGEFAEMLRARSGHDFNTTVSGSDHIITLSTCYDNESRMVLHAKLIKRSAK